jgi:hypothetical protein
MEKAYDLKALAEFIIEESKKDGLTICEEAVESFGKAIYVGFRRWAADSALVSETKIDDYMAPFYTQLDQFVLPQIEKIDLDGDGD